MFKITINNDPKKPRLEVIPELKSLLLTVYNAMPALTFEVVRDDRDKVTLVEGVDHYNKVSVFHGFQKVGYVNYGKIDHRGAGRQWVYTIYSNNINNKRGTRNSVKTVNAKVAIKKILEYFKPEPVDQLVSKMYQDAMYNMHNLVYNVQRNVRQELGDAEKAHAAAISYIVGLRTGTSVDMPDFPISANLPEHCIAFEIVRSISNHVENHNVVVVQQMRDGSMVFIDKVSDKPNVVVLSETYRSKEEVPSPYIEKMTMLSFVEPKQPIRDVGVRWQDNRYENLYIIVKGDIITDS